MRSLLVGAALSIVGAGSLVGCLDTQACTTEFRYGVSATVRSARDGSPVVGATLVLVDGSYRETMSAFGIPGSYAGAGERAGTYTLSVTAPGFASPATRTLVVAGGECHVNGVPVTIDLTPL